MNSQDNWHAAFADVGQCVMRDGCRDVDSADAGIDQTRAADAQQSHCLHTTAHRDMTETRRQSCLSMHLSPTASRQCLPLAQHKSQHCSDRS